ncbi:hypothetical protein HB943_02110 [Listeria weihenstephanensis]|uniref:Uncharacterized protein n=1 Tax=Listeria weihenstephanensis TaxID=1006155 RepID=A0A841Z0Q5_9LIST|nr:hypothetical protein [Listeria weihenstephanensis]MBC1499381.1 hypothetical protein [Listeria weihenstephanensis]
MTPNAYIFIVQEVESKKVVRAFQNELSAQHEAFEHEGKTGNECEVLEVDFEKVGVIRE